MKRFEVLFTPEIEANPDIRRIVEYQIELIKSGDSTLHLIPSE
jgi:hypothetical protein